jgi:hypothetical protein
MYFAVAVPVFLLRKEYKLLKSTRFYVKSLFLIGIYGTSIGFFVYNHMQAYNNNKHHFTDIIMYDKYGAVVWQKNNAIAYSGQGSFWCGPNVAKVAVRVGYSNPLGFFSPRVGSINVWY